MISKNHFIFPIAVFVFIFVFNEYGWYLTEYHVDEATIRLKGCKTADCELNGSITRERFSSGYKINTGTEVVFVSKDEFSEATYFSYFLDDSKIKKDN